MRRPLGFLFLALAGGFTAIAVASAWGAGKTPARWVVAAAAAALGLWMATLAWRALRPR